MNRMCLANYYKDCNSEGTIIIIIAFRDNRGAQGNENNWGQSCLGTARLVWAQTFLGLDMSGHDFYPHYYENFLKL